MKSQRRARRLRAHLRSAIAANQYILDAFRNSEISPALLMAANESAAYQIRMIEIALDRHLEAPTARDAMIQTHSAERAAQNAIKTARRVGYQPTTQKENETTC